MSGGMQFVKHAVYLSTLVLIRGLWVGKELTLDHRLQPCAYAQRGERRRRNLRRRPLPRLISSEPFQKHAQEAHDRGATMRTCEFAQPHAQSTPCNSTAKQSMLNADSYACAN